MADIDLSKMSDDELKALEDAIRRERVRRENERKREAEKKIKEIAAAAGLAVEIHAPGTRAKGRAGRGGLPPKYRNPDNPSQTWSGRGKRPAWFKEALEKGRKPEELLA